MFKYDFLDTSAGWVGLEPVEDYAPLFSACSALTNAAGEQLIIVAGGQRREHIIHIYDVNSNSYRYFLNNKRTLIVLQSGGKIQIKITF